MVWLDGSRPRARSGAYVTSPLCVRDRRSGDASLRWTLFVIHSHHHGAHSRRRRQLQPRGEQDRDGSYRGGDVTADGVLGTESGSTTRGAITVLSSAELPARSSATSGSYRNELPKQQHTRWAVTSTMHGCSTKGQGLRLRDAASKRPLQDPRATPQARSVAAAGESEANIEDGHCGGPTRCIRRASKRSLLMKARTRSAPEMFGLSYLR
jgi:hypothetical protein